MLNIVISWLKGLPQEFVVMVVGALPVSELRGAIPLGLYFGMPVLKAFFWAVLGNIIFVAPALFLFKPISSFLRKFKVWSRFFEWVFKRTKKNSEAIQKYEALGLVIFVAIPLPITGAWSGVVAASLFKIKFRYAFLAIVLGVIISGIIVSLLSSLGVLSWKAVVN
ncbi:MAG: small multi-drug export protein [Candidatus Omnitrophota bacterium]|jgi:uncharacterized membrane protein